MLACLTIDSIGLQIAMLRNNEEVYFLMYSQQTYSRTIVRLLNKLPGLGMRRKLGDDSGYCSDLEDVGMLTLCANKG
jgi:hypothetical protein